MGQETSTGRGRQKRSLSRVQGLRCALLLAACNTLALGQPLPITKAAQVHDLPAELAEKSLPVHLTATVTYYEPSKHTLFVADSSGAVYVKTNHPYPIHRGDLISIDGFTAKSFRTTVAKNPRIEVIGKGSFSRTKIETDRSYRELMAGKWDCQYVTMRGTVRSALVEPLGSDSTMEIEILVPGGIVQAYLQDFRGVDPEELIDSDVEISGVIGGDFNAQWQLMRSIIYASQPSELHILRRPNVPPSSLALTKIDDVMQTHSIRDESKRVRVRGTVTYYQPGYAVVVQHEGRSLSASTRQVGPIPLGSTVDLIGFAEGDGYAPTLVQTEILPTGRSESIKPAAVTYSQAIGGVYSDDLVSMRGTVISQMNADASDTLLLMVEKHAVTAVLQAHAKSQRLPELRAGTLVAVTGICRVTPAADWGTPGITPMLFRLDMRSPRDLQVLNAPSWWTVAHLIILVGALIGISLLIAMWAIVLRRKVADQTATIERTVHLEKARSRILESINSETPLKQLLQDICISVQELVPGLHCSCLVHESAGREAGAGPIALFEEPMVQVLFTHALTDSTGSQIGAFFASSTEQRLLSSYEREVLTAGASLANLALNQRRMYQVLNYTSTHDQLTSLPNRRLSDLNFEESLEEARRTNARLGVAYIDVDRFKQVNDEHGHKTGDLYLQQIAARLATNVRNTDKLARIGGDEFLLIATSIHSIEDAEAYRRRLENCFESPFDLDGVQVCGSASIGIAVYPEHGANAEELKRHADIDMYSAKRRRRAEHDEDPLAVGETPIFSPKDLDAALKNGQFALFYQPQFSPEGKLRGFEALLRLNDPILGIVTPDAFIGVAERNDVILPLGAWVLRQALRDASDWRLDAMEGVRMVVNVAARQMEHATFADEVMAALQEAGMPARCLEIEITERTIASDLQQAILQLNRLHDQGVRISIDDFGMEHSCLSALHKLPIDTLKIDRSFVRALHSEPRVALIVGAIVTMGNGMLKRIVAEGVETADDIQALAALGAVDLQGFYFSRPQPAETIRAKLDTWSAGVPIPPHPSNQVVTEFREPANRKIRRKRQADTPGCPQGAPGTVIPISE
jgi:diguanylate cyclase (GGDEF)-like protein